MSTPSVYQDRYWKELYQLRVHVYYLGLYFEQSEKLEKGINAFLAITSSSSICGWAIWNKYSFVWALIIAISQLITAVKQFLPFKKRMKAISSLLRDLEELLNFAEMRWFDVAEGRLTNEEINRLQFEIRKKKNKLLHKHLSHQSLPEKKKLFNKAKEMAQTYVTNFYGG